MGEGKGAPWPPLGELGLGRGLSVRAKRGVVPRPPFFCPDTATTEIYTLGLLAARPRTGDSGLWCAGARS